MNEKRLYTWQEVQKVSAKIPIGVAAALSELGWNALGVYEDVKAALDDKESNEQKTNCAICGELKHTPLRVDHMGGYVCLTCIDKELHKPDTWGTPIKSLATEVRPTATP